MSTSRGEQPGLRERKKAKTRAAVEDHALRLFIEQGYEQTTVEQIAAAAAEVSQSTFFRYFPAKEDTVGYDRLDPLMVKSFVAQPAELSPIAAFRATIREVLISMRAEESKLEAARQRLVVSVPELRMKLLDQIASGVTLMAGALAERTGRGADDFEVGNWAGAVVGITLSTYVTTSDDPGEFYDALDRSLAHLEAGLPL